LLNVGRVERYKSCFLKTYNNSAVHNFPLKGPLFFGWKWIIHGKKTKLPSKKMHFVAIWYGPNSCDIALLNSTYYSSLCWFCLLILYFVDRIGLLVNSDLTGILLLLLQTPIFCITSKQPAMYQRHFPKYPILSNKDGGMADGSMRQSPVLFASTNNDLA